MSSVDWAYSASSSIDLFALQCEVSADRAVGYLRNALCHEVIIRLQSGFHFGTRAATNGSQSA